MIKALTLWQPWAWLIIAGLKQYETRGWSTSYRGPLVIHAAKRKWRPDECNSLVRAQVTRRMFGGDPLYYGAALGLVDLVDVIPSEVAIDRISDDEFMYGDYSPRRFAWKLNNPRPFVRPVSISGKQGLWAWLEKLPELEVERL